MTASEKRKRYSTFCKIIGGGLLLFSFITQNYTYDNWNTRLEEFRDANRDFAAMHRSSLMYQDLYFNAIIDDTVLRRQVKESLIRNAAQKDAVGRMLLLEVKDQELADSKQLYETVRNEVAKVKDYPSFLAYLEKAQRIDEVSLKEEDEQVHTDKKWKDRCRNIFLGTYILGTIILLVGFRYE